MEGHPMLEREGYDKRAVPLGLHGDGVPVAGVGKKWSKSCLALSWVSLLSTGSTLDCNLLIMLLYKCLAVQNGANATMATVWKTLA
eukprot:7804037-Alexandrium_andersonii.AAC.1